MCKDLPWSRVAFAVIGVSLHCTAEAAGMAVVEGGHIEAQLKSAAVANHAGGSTSRNFLRLGFLRQAQAQGRARALQASEQAVEQAASAPKLLTPQPNDTIPEEYWVGVDNAIKKAAANTPAPPSKNDPRARPTPGPWEKILTASAKEATLDPEEAAKKLTDWEYATPGPPQVGKPLREQEVNVVPYDMKLGATIMAKLSKHGAALETPPPTQAMVNEAFVAQCPMMLLSSAVLIGAPKCQDPLGTWQVPNTDRTILRWREDGKGGLFMGVDSKVTGKGSVEFARISELVTLNKYTFALSNCMGVVRYNLDEQVIRVNHMAPHAESTMYAHDVSRSREAFFYKYVISYPNGTNVAETGMYRLDHSALNFTAVTSNGAPTGIVLAAARRVGSWKRGSWRDCTRNKRGWRLDFPSTGNYTIDTVATVQDLRVVAAAAMTLLAYREEGTASDGFRHQGQGYLYWSLVKSAILLFLAAFLLAVLWLYVASRNLDRRLRRLCFRLEAAFMPRRPANFRKPEINMTY